MSATANFNVVIVGAGHAGAQAAIALRQKGFTGSIGLIGEEPDPPYERPPLSKDYLAGDKPFERMLIRPEAFWAARTVALVLSTRIERIDAEAHVLTASDRREFGYGQLIWATGGRPRRLSCDGHNLGGVHAVRTRADVDALAGDLASARRVVVIGGGYIGLETAAVLTKRRLHVTVLEAQDRLLARVAGPALSAFFAAEHRARGVDVRLSSGVVAISGTQRADGVELSDGTHLPADLVIVGIGIVPATEPLIQAGAAGSDGVDVDENCRTSLPDVWAVGDCARHASRFARGAWIRLESVQNSNDMASCAAAAITGNPAPYEAVPWFWSNQYDVKLQTVGLSAGYDREVVRGDPGGRSFSVVYLQGGRVIALDCVNAVRDYVQGRALVAAGMTIDPDKLADPTIALKDLAAG